MSSVEESSRGQCLDRRFPKAFTLPSPYTPGSEYWPAHAQLWNSHSVINAWNEGSTRFPLFLPPTPLVVGPHGLTFKGGGGCCGLCLSHKNQPSCPLLFIPFLPLFLKPFQLYFIPQILPTTLRCPTLPFRSYFCLTGPFTYISFLYIYFL